MKNLIQKGLSVSDVAVIVFVFAFASFAFAHAQTTDIATQMGPGDSGASVSALQTFLATDNAIYPEGRVTGFYGSLTTAAVQRYQCKNGLVCTGSVATTGYGRVGPATLAKIEQQEGIEGGSLPIGDVSAPILSAPSVVTTATSAMIHWTTNEPAHSFLMYASVPPSSSFNSYETMPRVTDSSFDTSSDVTLSGLTPHTTYYYVLDSTDASGNLQYGIDYSFTTNVQ